MSKLRQQIKAYVAGQLDACTQPDPQNPKAQFRVSAEDGCPACIPRAVRQMINNQTSTLWNAQLECWLSRLPPHHSCRHHMQLSRDFESVLCVRF